MSTSVPSLAESKRFSTHVPKARRGPSGSKRCAAVGLSLVGFITAMLAWFFNSHLRAFGGIRTLGSQEVTGS
jgi:hypothetical protein